PETMATLETMATTTGTTAAVTAVPETAPETAAQATEEVATATTTAAEIASEAAPADEAEKTTEKAKVRVGALTLKNGRVDFSDRHIIPNYYTSLVEINGSVSGISSEELGRADVNLKGSLGHGAPLEIKGTINPLAENMFIDLNIELDGADLSPLTPYSGRYVGYGIEKGKLTLNLSYQIKEKKLDAQNKLFFDQFTLGNSVDSPDATNLPVRLALSILKDGRGEVHIDLPVSGDLSHPRFSFWGIVWQAVRNLMMKAVVAPFALMGSMFGDAAEQLSYIEFEPGSPEISQAGEDKVGNVARAMRDRPGLRLEIIGHADPNVDMEGLRVVAFRRKVASFKIKELLEAGLSLPPNEVTYQPEEYEKFLRMAYKEDKIPKPRNIFGIAKTLSVPEMEKIMIKHIQATESDLRQLAMDRAARVRDALIFDGGVEAGRLFLVEPKSLAPEKRENVKDSRVDLTIR
ncbi:MAG: DUF748 domain-containing protein, partial [Syntrophorhabdaceae bacterium]|nr:DUF748 domain-containing protein [Syntrophorhabdaceae bacterium]